MVFWNLCLAEVVDFFRMPAFCKEVKEITGEKFCIRVGNHICPLPFDIDEYRVRQTGDFLHCPVSRMEPLPTGTSRIFLSSSETGVEPLDRDFSRENHKSAGLSAVPL